MVVDFELNQKPFKQFSVGKPAKPNRTEGDLLISLEYSNGGGNPIVTLYKITERHRILRLVRPTTSTEVNGPDG